MFREFLAEGEKEFFFSLNKIAGSPIKDIVVMVSYEFGEPVLALQSIQFENGTSLFCGGEHDMAYISGNYGPHNKSTKFVVNLSDLRPREY